MKTDSPQSSVPGMPCQGCGARVIASMHQLLAGEVFCPACGFRHPVDRQQSREVLEALEELRRKTEAPCYGQWGGKGR